MASIFWVEDQTHWIDKFRDALTSSDFDGEPNTLAIFKFSQAARQKIASTKLDTPPDIAILDASMNGNDDAGFAVSTALRKKWPDLPIIYLSEHSGTKIEHDALEQFSATDFIAKHQRNIEQVLCWRIRAALRHSSISRNVGTRATEKTISSGSLTIDLDTWHVYWHGVRLMNPSNPKRPLAPTPRKILRHLVEISPRPASTEQIADQIDSDPDKFSYSTYRQHIKILRHSMGRAQGDPDGFMALCKSGFGIATFGDGHAYLWNPPVD